jgi:hypothetical protein
MSVNLSTQVKSSPEHFRPDPSLREQISNLFELITDTSGRAKSTADFEELNNLSSAFDTATSFLKRYLDLLEDVQTLHSEVEEYQT